MSDMCVRFIENLQIRNPRSDSNLVKLTDEEIVFYVNKLLKLLII